MNNYLLSKTIAKHINNNLLLKRLIVNKIERNLNLNLSNEKSTKLELNNGLQDIKISDKCVERLKKVSEAEKQFLRVEVESGGCSGLQYKFNISDAIQSDDRVFERNGVKVVIDETSLQYITGSTVDYNEELIKSAFRIINNPLSEKGCSCGASFSIKSDPNGFKF